MMTDEMLRAAAKRSSQAYTEQAEEGYDPAEQHSFSNEFEQGVKKLKRKANHPFLSRSLRKVASFLLVALIGGAVWLAVDVEAQSACMKWIRNIQGIAFSYHFSDSVNVTPEPIDFNYEPAWIPDGYWKTKESDNGSMITLYYLNEQNQYLRVHCVYSQGGTLGFSIENGRVKKGAVQNYEADIVLYEDPSIGNVIGWSDEENRLFFVSAFLEEDELLKLANSIYE